MRQKTKCLILTTLFLSFLHGVVFSLDTAVSLIINVPISRDFKNGEKHFYSVTARENEFIEIVCDRKGVDIGLAVFAPNGEKLSTSNATDGFAGRDSLAFIAEKAGEYRIELNSHRPGNIIGSYTILLKDKRVANENDLTRSAAMKFLGEAREILNGAENRYEKATQALEKLEKAVSLFEKSNDLQGQATALFHIANITANEFGDEVKAVEFFEKALEIWRKIDDDAGKAICLMRLGRESSDKGEFEKSSAYLTEALAINKKLSDRLGEAATLSILCRFYNDTGNFQKGFEMCRESQRLGQNSDPLTDYITYNALGSLYGNTGDEEKALEYTHLTLERILLTGDLLNPIRLATAKSNIARILFSQKKYTEALTSYQDALSVSQKVKRPKYEAYFLTRISLTFYELKQFDKALEAGEKSLALYRQHYARNRQAILNILSNIYIALGQNDKAQTMLVDSLEMNRQNKDRYAEAETLSNLAQLETRVGNIETALENVRQAINISEILRADLLGKNQRSTYLSILKRFYEFKLELLVKLYEKSSDAKYLEQAWQNQEKIRARSLLENFLENGFNLNDLELKDFFAKEQILLEKTADAEIKNGEAIKSKNANAQKEAQTNLQKALDDYHILQEELRKKNSRFSELNQTKEFAFADAQNLLDKDSAILEFALGERQSYAWLISKTSVKLVKLPAKNIINQTAREFYLALTNRESKDETATIEKARQLSGQILQPFAGELANVKRLVVIADGSLQLIPFSALTLAPDTTFQPLIATTEIVNAPSFSSLVFLRANKANRQTSPDKLLAIFADPIFQDDDERFAKNKTIKPKTSTDETAKLAQTLRDFGVDKLARLPFSGIEAREIAAFAPQKTLLALGANASRQNFLRGDFSSYRILHFATHGFLNQQNPDLSGLVLSLYDEKRQSQNGFLRVIDLYSMRLNADLVVLSACQTALGKDVDGEGIVGLTRGFMYAGASSVVSSLWKVEDAATAELMKRFYRAMLKENQTPPAALRIAQNEMSQIKRFRNPNNWAGFTLTGYYR